MRRSILLGLTALGLFALVPGIKADSVTVRVPGVSISSGNSEEWRREQWRREQWRRHQAWLEHHRYHHHDYDDEGY